MQRLGRNKYLLEIILLRHGQAGSRQEFQQQAAISRSSISRSSISRSSISRSFLPDTKRPLTKEGQQELKFVMKVLGRLVGQVDMILTSPLTRAHQTAQILNKKFSSANIQICNSIKPSSPVSKTFDYLRAQKLSGVVAIVGHEPHLSRFLSSILTGAVTFNLPLKKGGFAIIQCDQNLTLSSARLKCLVQPSQIKKILKK